VKEIFDKIFAIWKEIRISSEQESQINRCLNEIISKFQELNNLPQAIEKIETNLNYLMNSDELNDSHRINELYRYFNLLQEYSLNINNFWQVIEFFLKSFERIFFYNKKPNKCCFKESLLKRLTDNILYILDKSNKLHDSDNFFCNFICTFFNNPIEYKIKSKIYKVKLFYQLRISIKFSEKLSKKISSLQEVV